MKNNMIFAMNLMWKLHDFDHDVCEIYMILTMNLCEMYMICTMNACENYIIFTINLHENYHEYAFHPNVFVELLITFLLVNYTPLFCSLMRSQVSTMSDNAVS